MVPDVAQEIEMEENFEENCFLECDSTNFLQDTQGCTLEEEAKLGLTVNAQSHNYSLTLFSSFSFMISSLYAALVLIDSYYVFSLNFNAPDIITLIEHGKEELIRSFRCISISYGLVKIFGHTCYYLFSHDCARHFDLLKRALNLIVYVDKHGELVNWTNYLGPNNWRKALTCLEFWVLSPIILDFLHALDFINVIGLHYIDMLRHRLNKDMRWIIRCTMFFAEFAFHSVHFSFSPYKLNIAFSCCVLGCDELQMPEDWSHSVDKLKWALNLVSYAHDATDVFFYELNSYFDQPFVNPKTSLSCHLFSLFLIICAYTHLSEAFSQTFDKLMRALSMIDVTE